MNNIRQGRRGRDLPANSSPAGNDTLVGVSTSTGRTFRVPLSAVRTTYTAGSGLNLNENNVFSVDSTVVRTSREIFTGSGLTGGGTLASNRVLQVDNTVARTSTTLIGGSGINNPIGDLSANRTISVDETVARRNAANTLAGDILFSHTNPALRRSTGNAFLHVSGGSTRLLGGNIVCYGESYTPLPNTVQLRAGTTVRATSNAAGFTFTAPSDARIKAGIKPMPGLDIVRQLNPVAFRFNHEYRTRAANGLDARERYGFIAQEYAKVFPNAVEESEEVFKGEKVLQMTSQDSLVAAVAAIKELDQEVQSLRAELARLKGEST